MSGLAAPGWYADPHGAAAFRWWDGQTWTEATHPGQPAQAEPAYAQPVQAHPAFAQQAQPAYPQPAWAMPGYGQSTTSPYATPAFSQVLPQSMPQAGWERNRYAVITFGIVALYFFIAMSTRVVFFGVLPLAMSFRSKRGGEPWAPLAIGAAALSVLVAFIALSRH